MSTNETNLALSAATLANAISLPVDIADLVLGTATPDELIERGVTRRNIDAKTEEVDDLPVIHDQDAIGSYQLAANHVSRAAITKIKFK